jgi:hypothetical protein
LPRFRLASYFADDQVDFLAKSSLSTSFPNNLLDLVQKLLVPDTLLLLENPPSVKPINAMEASKGCVPNSYCYGCTNILGRSDQSPTFTFCDDGGRPFVTDYGAVSI